MATTLDDLNTTIAGLKEVIANNKNADGSRDKVLDEGALVATFTKALNEWNATNSNDAIRKGEAVGPLGGEDAKPGAVQRGGKFDGAKVDDLVFADWLLSKAKAAGQPGVKTASKELRDITAKALTATGAGTGDEYVPTGMAASLWNDWFVASRVVSTFGVVPMPTDPFDMPLGWGVPTWRKGTQNTATTVSDPATAKSTFTSTEQVCEIDFSYNLEEDAVVAILPTLREMLARDGAEQIDRFVMNADSTNAGTGNINLDDADPDDDSYYLSAGQDGLRHLMIVQPDGKPKLFISPRCENLIGEIRKYHWSVPIGKDERKRNAPDLPVDFENHAIDAMGYAIFTHALGDQKVPKSVRREWEPKDRKIQLTRNPDRQ